jgi:Raf kinase inhibitor-like YbhB/YbcL family protein
MGDIDAAIGDVEARMQIAKERDDARAEAAAWEQKAHVLGKANRREEAIECLLQSLKAVPRPTPADELTGWLDQVLARKPFIRPRSVEAKPSAGSSPEGDGMRLTSDAFRGNDSIPQRFTADGADRSPPLKWSGLPEGVRELALICDDPAAPTPEPWVHWVLYKLPADCEGLPEGCGNGEQVAGIPAARHGENSWGRLGYGGPAPPHGHGVHDYHFRLYALSQPIDLPAGANKEAVLEAIGSHVLAQAELVGVYSR